MDRRQFLAGSVAVAAGAVLAGPIARSGAAPAPAPVAASSPLPPRWWRRYWVDGKAPHSRRSFNAGTFAADSGNYATKMGAQVEFIAGNCIAYLQPPATQRANSWEKVIGGPYGAGDTSIMLHSQPNLRQTNLSRWHDDELPGSWAGLYLTIAPFLPESEFEQAYKNWTDIADGLHNDDYKRMGARFRYSVVSQLNKDPADVIMRPNWEFNQDTGLHPHFYAICKRKNPSWTNSRITQLYNAMMIEFATSFREGYQHHIPIALSPAMESSRGAPTNAYADWLQAGIYDMVCASFHPDPTRCSTEAKAIALVNDTSTTSALYTPGKAVAAARAAGLTVSFLEHSTTPRVTSGATFRWTATAYEEFAKLLRANPGIVTFTGVLDSDMLNRDLLVGVPTATAAQRADWRRMVDVHIANFGRVTG